MNISKDVLTDIDALIEALRVADEAIRYCCNDDPLALNTFNKLDVDSANEWKKMVARTAYGKMCEILKVK